MYLPLLHESSWYEFLLQVDRDLASEARRSGCVFCGAALHSASYRRHPRGLPAGIDPGPEFGVFFGLCCSADGCRRRHKPPSVRFLGPKVYLSVTVLLLTAMRQGPTPRTALQLQAAFKVSRRTLGRWRRWWLVVFPGTNFWQRQRARFTPPVDEDAVPGSMVASFEGGDCLRDRIIRVLKFLAGLFGAF